MNEDAMATAYFVEVADQLFDSFNGSLKKDVHGKKVKCWLTKTSPHLQFWEEAGPIVNGWEFVSVLTGRVIRPWSQDGWLRSIEGMKILINKVCEKSTETEPIYYIMSQEV